MLHFYIVIGMWLFRTNFMLRYLNIDHLPKQFYNWLCRKIIIEQNLWNPKNKLPQNFKIFLNFIRTNLT